MANGIAVHNSIEQDSDIVILLRREVPLRAGESAGGGGRPDRRETRNGPTDTITVAFQGHYSRFTNMAASF